VIPPIDRAILWSGTEAMAAGALSLTSAFIIAGLIGPGELGLAAAAVAGHVVLWVAVNALFADALVQREAADDALLSSAFWSATAVGVLALAGQVAIGVLLAQHFADARLLPMSLLLALPLPLVGMASVAQGLLTRRRAYRALALRTFLGQGAGVTVGLAGAWGGAGAWAPVCQQATTAAVGAVVLLAAARWHPRWHWRWAEAWALLAVGLPLTGSTLTQIARYRVFALLIGAHAGAAALGQVHMAFRLVDTVRELAFTALWRLFLPDLARFRHDRAAMLARVDRLLRGATLVILPLCAGLALGLPWMVSALLGPNWVEAQRTALPLVGLMGVLTVTFPGGVALIVLGQARFTLYANLAALAACVAAVLALRPDTAWDAVLIWCASQILVLPYILLVNARALGVGWWRPVRAGLGATCGLVLGGVVLAFSGT
jgi:PST family polysaccharide transporter